VAGSSVDKKDMGQDVCSQNDMLLINVLTLASQIVKDYLRCFQDRHKTGMKYVVKNE
jgi:hypothetical protein